jgi:hypothetical protein
MHEMHEMRQSPCRNLREEGDFGASYRSTPLADAALQALPFPDME